MLILLTAHLAVSLIMFMRHHFPNTAGKVASFLETSPIQGIQGDIIPWIISVFVCLILFLLVIFVVR